jgi:DNA-binding NarL/FixJ family response regulator
MERIRVLLVDDEPSVRRGLRMRLELEPDVDVVAEAANGASAVEMTARLEPEVVLMDVEMPVMNGIKATSEIRRQTPQSAVVVLSLHDDPQTVSRAKAAGAVAFIPKHKMNDDLLTAIRRAANKNEEGHMDDGPSDEVDDESIQTIS